MRRGYSRITFMRRSTFSALRILRLCFMRSRMGARVRCASAFAISSVVWDFLSLSSPLSTPPLENTVPCPALRRSFLSSSSVLLRKAEPLRRRSSWPFSTPFLYALRNSSPSAHCTNRPKCARTRFSLRLLCMFRCCWRWSRPDLSWKKEMDPCTRVRNNNVLKFLSLGTTLATVLLTNAVGLTLPFSLSGLNRAPLEESLPLGDDSSSLSSSSSSDESVRLKGVKMDCRLPETLWRLADPVIGTRPLVARLARAPLDDFISRPCA
mmetsp:Transcript_6741/g.14789  ORF Transcript_6741/g.14789 Transcript_6741/m.14789 type:complete len:266 (-) Transcript_6741:986-1783(-)